ncbi:MAG: hypothetical protein ACREX8_14100, partial [Gammaproteobacteria bacterium]
VCGWLPVGWPNPANITTWVRHHPSSVELSTNEFRVGTLRPDLEQTERPGEIRVYLHAQASWAGCATDEDSTLRLPAAVVLDTGTEQVRLDLPDAMALGTALHRISGRPPEPPCRCRTNG